MTTRRVGWKNWTTNLIGAASILLLLLASVLFTATATAADGETRQEFLSPDANRIELTRLQNEQTRLQAEQGILTNFLMRIAAASNTLVAVRFNEESAKADLQNLSVAIAALSNAPPTTALEFNEPVVTDFTRDLSSVGDFSWRKELSGPASELFVFPRNYNQPTPEEQLLMNLTSRAGSTRKSLRSEAQQELAKCRQLSRKLGQRGLKRSDLKDKDFADAAAEASPDHVNDLKVPFESEKNDLLAECADVMKLTQEAITQHNRDLETVGKRISQVDSRLAGVVNRQADINSMLVWAVFAVILAIVAIYAGLLYTKVEIARELITSRLVIELGTMAFLLLAVIILGLSEKLDKQSLGTLLGAMAGYLLARHSNPLGTPGTPAIPAPPRPSPLEIATIGPQASGRFQISYAPGTGAHAERCWLQWQVVGTDQEFGHDVILAASGQLVDTGAKTGATVRFRTRVENGQGTTLGTEKSAVSL